jgi:hypothetical protein
MESEFCSTDGNLAAADAASSSMKADMHVLYMAICLAAVIRMLWRVGHLLRLAPR